MSAKKFRFVSPGIFLNEIDNSQLPAQPRDIGPIVIGRMQRGPAMRPVQVDSFSDFVEMFGEPHPGGEATDAWRNGNKIAPTYAAYAAQAWLKNSSTINVVRLLGKEHQDREDAGKAGWNIDLNVIPATTNSAGGGSYGLWVFNNNGATETGSLAAVWYLQTGSIELTTEFDGKPEYVTSSNGTFTAHLRGNGLSKDIKFNLDPTSKDYIRKVFNTNPTLLSTEKYWLGETFERTHEMMGVTSSAPHGVILGLQQGSTKHHTRHNSFEQSKAGSSQTGWFVSQEFNSSISFDSLQKLFKIHDLGHGEWSQNNLKISIANIKHSQDEFNLYGTFDVLVRRISDTDKAPVVLERFSGCNLNPNSNDYIGRKIGTQYARYDANERRLKVEGQYPNNSKYIRVRMSDTVDAGQANEECLPFGVYGPLKYKDTTKTGADALLATASMVTASAAITASANMPDNLLLQFPKPQLRLSASQDDPGSVKDVYFGVWTGKTANNSKFNEDIRDIVRAKSSDVNQQDAGDLTENSFKFTLDYISGTLASGSASEYSEFTYNDSDASQKRITSGSYKDLLDAGIDSFTTVLAGGSDGFDVTKMEPLANKHIEGKTDKNNYAFNSYKESIDNIKDPEFIEYNIATIPGLTHEGLTTQLIETVESRADALAIIDLKGGFQPSHETEAAKSYGDVDTTVTNLKNRGLNSSYACTYYPWVQIRDTLFGNLVYMPPSVAALGAMSYTDRVKAPWFSPAGFNRGGLTSGVAGIPVVSVTEKLTSKQRDKLYEANINPIASFPSEGIVIFGQKTLQVTRSALDRINVRRLLLFVKKGISRIATDILFEPNVQETWDRFINQANPFLGDVKAQFGLTDFKLVLDKTTTTDDLIDQNVLYAKVFLKPARAIEFIAVDFVIANSGAAFED